MHALPSSSRVHLRTWEVFCIATVYIHMLINVLIRANSDDVYTFHTLYNFHTYVITNRPCYDLTSPVFRMSEGCSHGRFGSSIATMLAIHPRMYRKSAGRYMQVHRFWAPWSVSIVVITWLVWCFFNTSSLVLALLQHSLGVALKTKFQAGLSKMPGTKVDCNMYSSSSNPGHSKSVRS